MPPASARVLQFAAPPKMPERAKIYAARSTKQIPSFSALARDLGVHPVWLVSVLRGAKPSRLLAVAIAAAVLPHGISINSQALLDESSQKDD